MLIRKPQNQFQFVQYLQVKKRLKARLFSIINFWIAINYFNYKIPMGDQHTWSQQSDELLKYLYSDLNIFNWSMISKELRERTQLQKDPVECMNRYVKKYGPVVRDQWSPEEQKQLYRLHNQNGNKWAVISQNLLGRNDNSVKNHFYSKLRKSLRTLNKIAKLYLKKEAKEISDVVLYKLTQVTDQSLKQQIDLSKNVIDMSYQLKNKLLEYDLDQKDIRVGLDYSYEKELLNGLNEFNKIYKKKPKKEKVSVLGIENMRKYREVQAKTSSNRKLKMQENYQSQQEEENQKQKNVLKGNQSHKNQIEEAKRKFSEMYDISYNFLGSIESYNAFKSESEFSRISRPRKTLNVLIKAPSEEEKDNYQKGADLFSSCSVKQADGKMHQKARQPSNEMISSSMVLNKQKNKVEDILKAEGILENGEYGRENYFRRTNSVRSFSVCSQSSNPDMFGEDIIFLGGFKDLSDMEHSSQIFSAQHNQ